MTGDEAQREDARYEKRPPGKHVEYEKRPFADLWGGRKQYEVRRDDRGYAVGDILTLGEYDEDAESFTGRWIVADVVVVLGLDITDYHDNWPEDGEEA